MYMYSNFYVAVTFIKLEAYGPEHSPEKQCQSVNISAQRIDYTIMSIKIEN